MAIGAPVRCGMTGLPRKMDAPAGITGATKEESRMRASERELDIELEVGGIVTHGEEWGGQLVRHLTLPPGADFRPLFKGLPGDACQCAHWGYVIAGSIHVRYADGTEEFNRAGDLYYWPGGHTGWTDEGVTFIEFSPAAELRPVLEHVGAQLSSSV
jgi:hypothetical protein